MDATDFGIAAVLNTVFIIVSISLLKKNNNNFNLLMLMHTCVNLINFGFEIGTLKLLLSWFADYLNFEREVF